MSDPVQRRLAAILAADVVGYSRLIEADEAGTRVRLRAVLSELIEPGLAAGGGRIFKTIGDGLLAEFASAVDAVRSALDLQRGLQSRADDEPDDRRLAFRMGINLGDVIVEGEDIHGEGVNVAARLEGLCEPGEVYVSGTVHDHVQGKLAAEFDDLGERQVKHITRPVRVFRARAESAQADGPLALPDKPSIAVLPFTNMSGDPEQEFFSDGITEDIITAISRIRQFFVIARNTTFTYKGRAVDVQAVARDLGVRYVVEGSVRKGGNKVRITAQLIDGTTGNHLWAERYDRELEDIFAVQNEITQNIVSRLEPELSRAEYERAKAKPPGSLDAWELYQRALHHYGRWTDQENLISRRLFEQAAERDPGFAPAFAGLSFTYAQSMMLGNTAHDRTEALNAARKAVALDDKDAFGYLALGRAYHHGRSLEKAVDAFEQAVTLNPNSALGHSYLGLALVYAGTPSKAIPHLELAIRLSPSDPEIGNAMSRLAGAHFYLRQYEQSIVWARKAMPKVSLWITHAFLTASLAYLGRDDEAAAARAQLLAIEPRFDLDFVRSHLPSGRLHLDQMIEGLRKAGFED